MKRILLAAGIVLVLIAGIAVKLMRANDISARPGAAAHSLVALGDSVTAGDGLPAVGGDNPPDCQRSSLSYPVLMARDTHLALHQFACSGAKVTTGLLQAQATRSSLQPPQLQAAQSYLKDSDVVMTIGANDVNGVGLLAECAQPSDCLGTTSLAEYQAALPQLTANLDQALAMIKAAHPHQIVVNTYYALAAKNDTCFQNFGLSSDKVATIIDQQAKLNQVIRASAQRAGATVVDIDFSGHGLCASQPWIQGVLDRAPLHPTEEGQQQIAYQDEQALK